MDPAEHRRRRLREGREGAGAWAPDETLGLGSGAWGGSSKTETQSPGPLPDCRKLAVYCHPSPKPATVRPSLGLAFCQSRRGHGSPKEKG